MNQKLKITEGSYDGHWLTFKDTETKKSYTLSYNYGLDFVLITEDLEDGYKLINYFHGTLKQDNLLESAMYYINKYNEAN